MADMTIFEKLSGPGKELLANNLARRTLPKGKLVIEKGAQVSGAYFVMRGRLRVFAYSPSGKEATLYFISPGETCILALNSLFNDLLYPAWVEAEEPTTLGVLSGAAYRSLFQREPAVQDLTVRALSAAVFRLMDELERVHSCRVDQRLASFLLNHASGEGVVGRTQREIAAHIGTSREVVARLMAELAGRGLVETARGRVRLLQPSRLAALFKDGGDGGPA
jgi:CRP/FNR family transcriptional regulator